MCVNVRVSLKPSGVYVLPEVTGGSPLLQYRSSRLVLSHRLPHEAILSDILPRSSPLPSLSAAPPALGGLPRPPFAFLRLVFTPSPLPVSPTSINIHIHTSTCLRCLCFSRSSFTASGKPTFLLQTHFRFLLSN